MNIRRICDDMMNLYEKELSRPMNDGLKKYMQRLLDCIADKNMTFEEADAFLETVQEKNKRIKEKAPATEAHFQNARDNNSYYRQDNTAGAKKQ